MSYFASFCRPAYLDVNRGDSCPWLKTGNFLRLFIAVRIGMKVRVIATATLLATLAATAAVFTFYAPNGEASNEAQCSVKEKTMEAGKTSTILCEVGKPLPKEIASRIPEHVRDNSQMLAPSPSS